MAEQKRKADELALDAAYQSRTAASELDKVIDRVRSGGKAWLDELRSIQQRAMAAHHLTLAAFHINEQQGWQR